jgi:uncharacterized protein YkwD
MLHYKHNQIPLLKTMIIPVFSFLCAVSCPAQQFPELNTAGKCNYMKPAEQEMIYEINVVRSHPEVYVQYLQKFLKDAKSDLKSSGNEIKNYSIETEYTTIDGKTTVKTDTIWFRMNEEEVKAIESLISDLRKLKPLGILKPDAGIYNAARLYGADQEKHHWKLSHRGSDGSWPDDRIKRSSRNMIDGNENIAGKYPEPTAREIVLQLLIDSGIKGYGHRYNILNPKWTHVACFCGGLKNGMYRWLQEFGQTGKPDSK